MIGPIINWLVGGLTEHFLKKGYEMGAQATVRGVSRLSGHRETQIAAATAVADSFLSSLKQKDYETASGLCTDELLTKLAASGGMRDWFAPYIAPKSWLFIIADDSGEENKWGELFALRLTYFVTYRKNVTRAFTFTLLLKDGWKVDGWAHNAPQASAVKRLTKRKSAPRKKKIPASESVR